MADMIDRNGAEVIDDKRSHLDKRYTGQEVLITLDVITVELVIRSGEIVIQ